MTQPSIDEVARVAGVHKSTVSRALSRPEVVREETREHILRVAESLGYEINPLAAALRRKSSNLVPLIVPDITNPFFGELASTMTAAAEEHGYRLVLCVTDGADERTGAYLESMQNLYAPFGIIAPSTRIDPEALHRFPLGKRVVVVDKFADGSGVPTVTMDNARGIELAFEHLRGLGHRSIAYVSGISGTYTAAERRAAYLALAEQPLLLGEGTQPGTGKRAAEEFLALAERPTAIVAGNDMVAFGVIAELGSRGVGVPGDVSVVGFDGLALGERYNPGLTTVQQPINEMGRVAIALARNLVDNGEVGHVVLEPSMTVRGSTARVPG
ncbi:LacI family transcriptional regulator [Actinoplanes bogorensis]|uniref:LacI family transcriptional regulator n=1 Tax=Paractinoplanes bogorensis TaxID=1610840 RepID=A0ABS5Z3B8_9ACTN|nr:LacI family DNA-binding transcriptional regulator [Actinoplanes bogorensis]MBU2670199.1 LacI family transcriptional regulator [Actinoplanes bogorensis]